MSDLVSTIDIRPQTDETGNTVWEGEYLPFGEPYSITGMKIICVSPVSTMMKKQAFITTTLGIIIL